MTPTLPVSIEAEQSVLGALLLDPAALAKVNLSPGDFYRRDHRLIFEAVLDLDADGKPYDAVTVAEWLESCSKGVDSAYIVELASSAWSAGNVAAYADIVRDKARLRRVIEIGTELVQSAYDSNGQSSVSIVDDGIGALMELSKAEKDCEFTLRQAVRMAWEDASRAYESGGVLQGITTGYRRMDDRLGGWHKGDLVFVGARPSMGKTALLVNFALNAAAAGHFAGIISGEQSAKQLGQRSLAVDSRVPAEAMRRGMIEDEHWPKLNQSMTRLVERKVRILDRSAPDISEVIRTARRWKQEYAMEVLFVDYLQRIAVKGAQSRIDEVSEVARALKTLARDLDIPVVCLAQVKAEVDKRNDKRPGLGDIANSDEATREADLIGFLYRDEVYNPNTNDRGVAELNFEKNRHGPTGQFLLHFNGETMMFGDLEL